MYHYIDKGGDEIVPVRLAWFSDGYEDNKYHICLNCRQYSKIKRRNLQIVPENKVPHDRSPCSDCKALFCNKACDMIVLRVMR